MAESVLKAHSFLLTEKMVLKDFQTTQRRRMIDRATAIGPAVRLIFGLGLLIGLAREADAQSSSDGAANLAKFAMKLPEKELLRIEPRPAQLPANSGLRVSGLNDGTGSAISGKNSLGTGSGEYAWKEGVATTVFWVGEQSSVNNPVSNDKSAWDPGWVSSYGGTDNPNAEDRANFLPVNFTPRQNPFYVALPYNDIDDHHTKPEAAQVIPWFNNTFVRDGQSVCKGRWIVIRHGRKVCYAQWEDVGPFQTDHWQYVFGNERPRPNRNQDAGLDVSPAVREYLGLGNIDFCDWKFVEFFRVPIGPWALYGDNNTFSRIRRPRSTSVATSHHQPPPF